MVSCDTFEVVILNLLSSRQRADGSFEGWKCEGNWYHAARPWPSTNWWISLPSDRVRMASSPQSFSCLATKGYEIYLDLTWWQRHGKPLNRHKSGLTPCRHSRHLGRDRLRLFVRNWVQSQSWRTHTTAWVSSSMSVRSDERFPSSGIWKICY